jgi:hypothetical protein
VKELAKVQQKVNQERIIKKHAQLHKEQVAALAETSLFSLGYE